MNIYQINYFLNNVVGATFATTEIATSNENDTFSHGELVLTNAILLKIENYTNKLDDKLNEGNDNNSREVNAYAIAIHYLNKDNQRIVIKNCLSKIYEENGVQRIYSDMEFYGNSSSRNIYKISQIKNHEVLNQELKKIHSLDFLGKALIDPDITNKKDFFRIYGCESRIVYDVEEIVYDIKEKCLDNGMTKDKLKIIFESTVPSEIAKKLELKDKISHGEVVILEQDHLKGKIYRFAFCCIRNNNILKVIPGEWKIFKRDGEAILYSDTSLSFGKVYKIPQDIEKKEGDDEETIKWIEIANYLKTIYANIQYTHRYNDGKKDFYKISFDKKESD